MIPTKEISKITSAPIAKSQESSSAAGERRVELAVLALAASSVPGRACADQKNEYFTKNPENKLAKLAASLRGGMRPWLDEGRKTVIERHFSRFFQLERDPWPHDTRPQE